MMVSCQYSFLYRLQLVSRHVIEVQEIGFKKFGTELRRGWPPTDFFLGLGVTVTEINIKKVQKQDLKKH